MFVLIEVVYEEFANVVDGVVFVSLSFVQGYSGLPNNRYRIRMDQMNMCGIQFVEAYCNCCELTRRYISIKIGA